MRLAVPPDRKTLVSDFDGTLTRRDFYQLVQERLPAQSALAVWEDYRAGRISHFEALRTIFDTFQPGETELLRLADEMELDPNLAAGVAALRAAGWEVVIASAGCA
jgi:2-hydroxy-3-keto-5-methylthiopentenyl-1-phosphate phosphatase